MAEAGALLRGQYTPFNAAGFVLAERAGASGIVAARTGHKIVIQRITIAITTAAAQEILVRDTAGTPLVAASLAASAAIGPYTWDFGEEGLPMTEGKALDLSHAAGPAYSYAIVGYYRQTAVLTEAQHKAS